MSRFVNSCQTRSMLLCATFSVTSAPIVLNACYAADTSQESRSEAQPANASSQTGASANESLDDILKETDSNDGTQLKNRADGSPDQLSQSARPPDAGKSGDGPMPAQDIHQAPDAALSPTIPVGSQPNKRPPEQSQNHSSPQIEEIVVTATKREESLRDIPASITAVTGEELEQRDAQDTQDIVKNVPGVNYMPSAGTPGLVTIRGISSQPDTGFTSGTLFGDVSFTDEYVPLVALDPNPFDMRDVEVLKGPQGTLFGGAALNGSIRYVPEGAHYGEWQGKYFTEGVRFSEGGTGSSYGGMLNIPLYKDSLALRVVGLYRITPGYVDNIQTHTPDSNEGGQEAVRTILGWKALNDLEFNLTYASQNTHLADKVTADNLNGNLVNGDSPRTSPSHQRYDMGDLKSQYRFDWADAVSDTAYVHKGAYTYFDISDRFEGAVPALGNSIPLVGSIVQSQSYYWSQEFRLASPNDSDSPWKWVTGVFYSRQLIRSSLDTPTGPALPISDLVQLLNGLDPGLGGAINGTSLNLLSDNVNVVSKQMAWFGELTRTLGSFDLTLGGRLYRTHSGGKNLQDGLLVDALFASASGQTFSGDVVETGFNPKASLLWRATDDINAYTTISRGSRPGGVQPGLTLPVVDSTQAPATFKSDNIWNYEAGLRTNWLDNTLHLDVSTYYERWNNPQYDQLDNAGLTSFLTNVGGVKTLGTEASVVWLLPIEGLMISSSGSHAKTVTTNPFTNGSGAVTPAGSPWPFAPTWQTSNTIAYIFDISTFNFNGGLTFNYIGKAINSLAQQSPVFDYSTWDAHFNVSNTAYSWLPSLTLSVNNLTDRRGIGNRVYSSSPPLEYNEVYYIPPRQLSLRLTGRF